VQNVAETASAGAMAMGDRAGETAAKLIELVSAWGLQVIGAIALLVIGRWVAGRVGRLVRGGLERAKTDPALVPFFAGMAYYAVLAAVVIAVLGLFGIETTSFVAILASAGLAIGLAMQGTLSNFSAGVMLLVFRPFRPGEYVEAAGVAGVVAEVGLFSTHLNTPDNVRIVIPNSKIFGDVIKNYASNGTRRVDIALGIRYGDDLGVAISTAKKVIGSDARVLGDPAPVVAVGELGESSVKLLVRPWCRSADYWDVLFDLTRRLKEELEAAGCRPPHPQREVELHAANGRAAMQ
jgi:small conductance mechanosensitive channel